MYPNACYFGFDLRDLQRPPLLTSHCLLSFFSWGSLHRGEPASACWRTASSCPWSWYPGSVLWRKKSRNSMILVGGAMKQADALGPSPCDAPQLESPAEPISRLSEWILIDIQNVPKQLLEANSIFFVHLRKRQWLSCRCIILLKQSHYSVVSLAVSGLISTLSEGISYSVILNHYLHWSDWTYLSSW